VTAVSVCQGTVWVETTQDRIGDLRELRDLVWSQGVDHVLAHERDASRRRVLDLHPPVIGEACVGGPLALGTREPFDEGAALPLAGVWLAPGMVMV
jgi:hypothetical protein